MEYTPEVITELKPNQVFVFGSNESGIHGAGAAKFAREKFGAKYGVGFGLQGKSFALPTKDWQIKTLPIGVIGFYIGRFLAFAKTRPDLEFLVTKLGTGLAGIPTKEIAILFHAWGEIPSNVVLPKEFSKELLISSVNP